MNARNARLKQTYRNQGAHRPRPLNVGTIFETLGETTLGGRPGSRGLIIAKLGDNRYRVRMHTDYGQVGEMHGIMMQAV